jgi:hypothetical protein
MLGEAVALRDSDLTDLRAAVSRLEVERATALSDIDAAVLEKLIAASVKDMNERDR